MTIGIIGSRKMSEYGKEVVEWLMKELMRRNVKVVTGCTRGINELVAKLGGSRVEIVTAENFEIMNWRIAKKADVLVIVEGGEKSGTILVAQEMLDLGKEVWCVPGRITDENSKACNFLIKNGAGILEHIDDLL